MQLPYITVQMYDPETDIWTREADVPFQRAAFSAGVVNNRIYAIGGTDTKRPIYSRTGNLRELPGLIVWKKCIWISPKELHDCYISFPPDT